MAVDRLRAAEYTAAFLGLAISIYLTLYHYSGVPLVCSESGLIDCASVLNSQYAYILGLPIAVYGIIFFAVAIFLLYFRNIDTILIWDIVGIGSVAYFVDIERIVGHICIWCTSVHVLVVLLFGSAVYRMFRKSD